MRKKINIPNTQRLPWINLGLAYLYAAETISDSIKEPSNTDEEKWRKIIIVIPLLYSLRQALELGIKSIFISYSKDFDPEHNLEELLKEARKHVDLKSQANQKKWLEIEDTVREFSKTTYGGKRMFNDDDTNSTALRYLQVNSLSGYGELRNIKHEELIGRVRRASVLLESFTLHTDPSIYLYPKTV